MDDMHPEDIKAAIRKRGTTLADLAAANGVSKQALGLAINARVSARCEGIIADFLERPASEIWPSRYGKDGQRIKMRRAA
ncbi:helix-turn-helix domain-containing protein [Novosphingobium sp. EMRT-2]|uniref:helix-turn-helix domain-containing protein n=1 Tax=Novosphingobium sp. EMRT-2 TaxID=2571749 RepID=UPI0010BDB649|nr:helix-turn-helix domain-containing protein [Novosphingobium sp. EMRT-2]QCI93255.1 transcriptional regulator [Novosphingobium sp. EMRT-2]